jgi:uncharacterized membrane protein
MNRLAANRIMGMKQTTIGVFEERTDAEKAIDTIYKELNIPADDISFLYRNTDGEVREVKTDALLDQQVSSLGVNVTIGALSGFLIGGAVGVTTVLGYTAFLQGLIAVGPLASILAAIGIVGNLAIIIGTALIGAILGVLGGALAELALSSRRMKIYSDNAEPKNIVVAVIAPERTDVLSLFRNLGAFDTRVYRLSI